MAKNNVFSFYKMSGGGNDFVLFDNRKDILPKDHAEVARNICRRKFSVGADGLLLLEKCSQADFRMVIYNSDGSRAEMCGNGARCIARFAFMLKAAPVKMKFMTDAGLIAAEIKENTVKLKMGDPKDLRLDFSLKAFDDKEVSVSFINSGVPHAVLLVTDMEKIDVYQLGKNIRNHKEFAPAGTNANFVLVRDPHTLLVRTYERGVENETLACGTGTVASALVCAAKGLTASPVSCLTKGGETLQVYFQMKRSPDPVIPGKTKTDFSEVYLEGPATVCFTGEVEL